MLLLASLASPSLAALGDGFIAQSQWSFKTAPPEGLDDIAFPFNIRNAPRKKGFYFAQQFDFTNNADFAYCGLQPQEDENGKPMIRALFSSFQRGSDTNDPNCSYGADGGPGISCAVKISASYEPTYFIRISSAGDGGNRTWRGTLIEHGNGKETHIGEWTLPEAGKIRSNFIGLVEYFPWNLDPDECSRLPRTEVSFGHPTSETCGAQGGEITETASVTDGR
ncbi:hypothetical protein L249_3831 [Ophiocordyceps polyrhachis-furcata BCC 54312]|uniref:Uncharacterized protein n=1 Tax=Ophiocordyceps polyrhachis-furcata BCC 54312 TaxID=1330021 RepID=A0A367L5I3_9HYPO|nr:hypothetical protein L249_3831 [Ophiocordyceps polyrhachis-furcata BCC 54312]